ncbi:MAG: DUF4417 domain-containing protein [Methylococcales bacterium]|nr:DUF4417 domain-containing protein [Methylococcales bacterium]
MAKMLGVPFINYGRSYNNHCELYPPISNKLTRRVKIPREFWCWNNSHNTQTLPKHCYVADWRLEAIWRNELYSLHHVAAPKISIAPDFSVHLDDPVTQAIYQVFRSRCVARFWQENGVFVIPTISWSRPEINEFLFRGLEHCEIVAIRTAGKNVEREWRESVEQFLSLCRPKLVLQFGTKLGLNAWNCEVLNLNVANRK